MTGQENVHAAPAVTKPLIVVAIEVIISQLDGGESCIVFLPGLVDIYNFYEKLECTLMERRILDYYTIFVRHSSLSPSQQKEVCRKTPPQYGKIILATNIAESSVTICDLRIVIDFGIEQNVRVGEGGLSTVEKSWCSQVSCEQRAGRVGRVKQGTVVRMFSEEVYRAEFPVYAPSALSHTPLDQLLLQCRQVAPSCGVSMPSEVLELAMHPPSREQIRSALYSLLENGAIVARRDELFLEIFDLSLIGQLALSLPVSVSFCRLNFFSLCIGSAVEGVVMAAYLSQMVDVDIFDTPTKILYKHHAQYAQHIMMQVSALTSLQFIDFI